LFRQPDGSEFRLPSPLQAESGAETYQTELEQFLGSLQHAETAKSYSVDYYLWASVSCGKTFFERFRGVYNPPTQVSLVTLLIVESLPVPQDSGEEEKE
jgi:hypothetical protein